MSDLFGNHEVRALSWKQPYASLMLHGKIETRKWPTKYRGLVLICASKTGYKFEVINNQISGSKQCDRIWLTLECERFKDLPSGQAIALGELVDCRKMRPEDEDACFVKYNPDLWCHIYRNVRAIQPFDYKGSQGWRKITNDLSIINQIRPSK